MIVELGHFTLILALICAVVQTGAAAWRPASFLPIARRAALAQGALIAASFAALIYTFAVSDFSVSLVVENSHTLKPLIYKIAGTWGNHEGSMLLWVLILAAFGALSLRQSMPDTLRAPLLAVQGAQGIGFLAFILFTSNPFTRLSAAPIDGNDLNPLLQDIGLALHPPLLYIGYVGFSIVFSFACAGLVAKTANYDWRNWAGLVRPWVLTAWSGLSAGIALGSWWAYYELGWGGFWFWDPVENASLMPWLCGTALLHSIIITRHRGALPRWTVFLALLAYTFSLLGTFLVRSGVLTSVHSFAADPSRGLFILGLLAVFAGGGFMLYALRAPDLKSTATFQPISRESALVFNNLILSAMAATILMGTLYPMILSSLNLGQISVGPPFFNATILPLAVPLVLLMGIGPLLAWKKADMAALRPRIIAITLITAACTGTVWALETHIAPLALGGLALGGFAIVATLDDTWAHRAKLTLSGWGMRLAHIGLGVAVIGITGTTLWKVEHVDVLSPGQNMSAGRWTITLDDVEAGFGPNYSTIMAHITARTNEKSVPITPERRYYPVGGVATTEAGIHTSFRDDIYIVLGQQDQNGWIVRATTHPLVAFIWSGFALISIGGICAFFGQRRQEQKKSGGHEQP